MNKHIRVYDKLVTLVTVRRGDWFIKVSVYNGQILLIATQIDLNEVKVKAFRNPNAVYDYIEQLVKEEK